MKNRGKCLLLMSVLLFLASLIGIFFDCLNWSDTNMVLVYLLAVLLTSTWSEGYIYGIIASVVATFLFNYLFTAPYYTLSVYDSRYFVTFVVMLLTAIITSTLTSKIQISTAQAKNNEEHMKTLYTLTNHLSDVLDDQTLGKEVIRILSQFFHCQIELIFFGNKDNLKMSGDINNIKVDKFDNKEYMLKFKNIQTSYLCIESQCHYPLYGIKKILGVLILPEGIIKTMGEQKKELLLSMIENISLSLEHINAIEEQLSLKEETVKERYRSNLLRAISHDLRTPLTGIMGTSEMIMSIHEDNESYQLASEIYDDAKWLYLMVENILSLTKVQEGKLYIHKDYEPVEEIIGSAIYRITKNKEDIDIEVKVPDRVLMVPVDARLIEQVIINLLDNAIKHEAHKIDIEAYENDHRAYIVVKDYGQGFKDSDLRKMFEMFYVGDREVNIDSKKGVGLGLTICKAIVEAHGGYIKAKNCQEHQGGEFCIELPMEES